MNERERLIELLTQAEYAYLEFSKMFPYTKSSTDFTADYLLANGVIVPPCKVGDMVYEIDKDCFGCNHFKEYWGCNYTCKREPEGNLFDVDYDKDCKYSISETPFNYALLNYIGKTVFLTKEEAEAAPEGGGEE